MHGCVLEWWVVTACLIAIQSLGTLIEPNCRPHSAPPFSVPGVVPWSECRVGVVSHLLSREESPARKIKSCHKATPLVIWFCAKGGSIMVSVGCAEGGGLVVSVICSPCPVLEARRGPLADPVKR